MKTIGIDFLADSTSPTPAKHQSSSLKEICARGNAQEISSATALIRISEDLKATKHLVFTEVVNKRTNQTS